MPGDQHPRAGSPSGYVQCSAVTGCGGRWAWRTGATEEDVRSFTASWTSEQAAREWAKSHLNVCDGPVDVVTGQEAA
jgi:hypothetical protein